jgi:uncharacterized protein YdhG (YjbR/CyaY superfamily)
MKRPSTIAEYIAAAPAAGRPHLSRLYSILKTAAPDAEETFKWSQPFFVEPRFLFAFAAHKSHLSFVPMAATLAVFRNALAGHQVTQLLIKFPYDKPLPEALIRKIAKYRVKAVAARKDDSFWDPASSEAGTRKKKTAKRKSAR